MAKKSSTVFMCTECGNEFPRWAGQCPACKAWNTLVEMNAVPHSFGKSGKGSTKSKGKSELIKPKKLSSIDPSEFKRTSTGIVELDRTIGGGLVTGQVILLGGHPGIGKSTLLLQLASTFGKKVLYASGEESESQIALRADRLKVKTDNIDIISTGNVDSILHASQSEYVGRSETKAAQNAEHDLIIIDSIQVMYTDDIESQAGSITQIRECAARIVTYAKSENIPIIIVGHITKEGTIAGPKVLEHMVDTVLYLEGDRQHLFRMMRVNKNRFGDDSEVGIFSMDTNGLQGVANPSSILLEGSTAGSIGTAVSVILEGSRPLAVEVQALTTKTSFGYPKRAASGFSLNRLQLLCAVIQKKLNLNLLDQDVYLNVASGLNVKEPAIDLAVCAAIVSSYTERAVKKNAAFFGEVGLGGEVRNVVASDRRIKEANNLGYTEICYPKNINNISKISNSLL
jgi:DNA repair protein RadA/Sms